MNLEPVEHFFEHVYRHFWVGATANQQQTHPKVMTNMLKKVFNWSEVHLSEVTSYKIHILVSMLQLYTVPKHIFCSKDSRNYGTCSNNLQF